MGDSGGHLAELFLGALQEGERIFPVRSAQGFGFLRLE
jgi:hypothetical protein